MAFTKQSKGDWTLYTETVSLNSASADQSTSVIDFIPYGLDWIIEVDPSATLATNAPVDLDYCYTSGGTYVELATTGATVLKAGTASRAIVDNSGKGNAPYYKLRFDKAGALDALAAKSIVVTIAVPPKNGIVY
jgi:hypothetical protein